MSGIGEILKNAREAKGISIQQVADATSIRALYLEAIESENFDIVPGEVYLKGFIRNYGNYLGLDGANLVEVYKKQVKPIEEDIVASVEKVEQTTSNTLRNKRKERRGYSSFNFSSFATLLGAMRPIFKIVAPVVVVVGLGYFAYSFISGNSSTYEEKTNNPVNVTEQNKVPVSVEKVTVTKAEDGTYGVKGTDKIIVKAVFEGDCWTEVKADGKDIFVGMMNSGKSGEWEANTELEILMGNVRAVRLTGNDVDITYGANENGTVVRTFKK